MRPTLDPVDTADSWQLSNPPIFAMAPVLASLEMFAEVGMDNLRERSIRLTGYLESLLDGLVPRAGDQRHHAAGSGAAGCPAVGPAADGSAKEVARRMWQEHGVIADSREPDVIRLAPAPLYVSYHDCWRAAHALVEEVDGDGR